MKQLARRVALATCVATATPCVATTWIVDPSGPITSIQEALDGAVPGDVVRVHTGTYHERLVLRDGVNLIADPGGSVTVDAEGEGSVVSAVGIGSSTLVSGMSFRNGSAVNGGGLFALASSPTFTDCNFESNVAVLGGGVYLRDASRTSFIRCVFAGNKAAAGGGIYLDFSQAQVSASFVYGNEAADGAAISANNAAEASFITTTIYTNYAREGATIAMNLASPRFTNCTVALNFGGATTFGARGSGSRIERCIVAFNFSPALVCSGSNALWVGCNVIYRNADDAICSGDQGTNIFADPQFCSVQHLFFGIAASSPAADAADCGTIGSLAVSCPAQGVETAVNARTWGQVKQLYAR